MSTKPETGDAIRLTVATSGRFSKVEINGQEMRGVTGFTVRTNCREASTVTIDAIFPWPPQVEGEGVERHARTQVFDGYFVSKEDWGKLRASVEATE